MCLSVNSENINNNIKSLGNQPLQKNNKIWNSPFFRQMYVALGPLTLIFCGGIGLGTATVMIPQIKANSSSMELTQDMESWIYSVNGFGATPSVLTVPYFSQVKGYKFVFMLICLPMIIAFILQYLATSATHLLIAAIFQGLTMGGNVTLGVIIVSEFADPKYRGTFLIIKSATLFWGIWTSNAVGTCFSWRTIPLVGIFPALFALVSSFTWPESPYWLANKNRMEECKNTFRWARGQGTDAENELTLLTNPKPSPRHSKKDFVFFKTTMFSRQFYMPLFLNIAMFFMYHSCGKFVCQTYVLDIIKGITGNSATAYTGMLIMDGVTVFGMYLGSYVAAKVRRRTLLLCTTASTIVFLFLFSAYLYLIKFNLITQNNSVSLCLLILYSFSVSWGPMVLCTSIFSEITPMRYKPFITSVTVGFMFVMQSVFLKLAPYIFRGVGVNGTFAVYGVLTTFPFLFLYKFLPETRNKTLKEIESFFVNRDVKESHRDDNSHEEGQEMLSYRENTNP